MLEGNVCNPFILYFINENKDIESSFTDDKGHVFPSQLLCGPIVMIEQSFIHYLEL